MKCCFSVWRFVDFYLVPRSHYSCPWKYLSFSSPILLAHSAQYLSHSAQLFLLSVHFLLLGAIPIIAQRNLSVLHYQRDPCHSSHPLHHAYHSWNLQHNLSRSYVVPDWRRCLFLIGFLVDVLIMLLYVLLVEVLRIFFLFRSCNAVLGFVRCWMLQEVLYLFCSLCCLLLWRDTGFSVSSFLFEFSVLGRCSHCLSIFNVHCCVVCSLILQ